MYTVLSWLNFEDRNPAADSSNFGPIGEYNGVYTPWLTNDEERKFYPTNYSGPPYATEFDGPNLTGRI